MAKQARVDRLITIELTVDEAAALYRAYVNGIHIGTAELHQSLSIKIERAQATAQTIRAADASWKIRNGQEKATA